MDTAICGDDDTQQPHTHSIPKAAVPSTADGSRVPAKPPLKSTRSLSDSEGTPHKLSPSPHIFASPRKQSQDDSKIRDSDRGHVGANALGRSQLGQSRDDSDMGAALPVTPRRTAFGARGGLSLQMTDLGNTAGPGQSKIQDQGLLGTPPAGPFARPHTAGAASSTANGPPQSPRLPEHAAGSPSIYASPPTGNLLPRRSRGLDFSRAATSLHHSILAADQTSPEASPTIGSRAMNITGGGSGLGHSYKRRSGEYGGLVGSGLDPLWGMGLGGHGGERMHMATSLGSVSNMVSDASSSSEDDDFMDEDMDDGFITTPQVSKTGPLPVPGAKPVSGSPWMPGSPAIAGPLSFQQRQLRPRKRLRQRGPLAAGTGMAALGASPAGAGLGLGLSRSPPTAGAGLVMGNMSAPGNGSGATKEFPNPHSRRESISWAANQLHISGSESDDNHKTQGEASDAILSTPSRDGSRVVRRVVTRRGNMLPKTKGFARIRAALAEEGAPIETEFRREAEVVRQVRESDMDLEPFFPASQGFQPPSSAATTALSSPTLVTADSMEESLPDDSMAMDINSLGGQGLGLSSASSAGYKQQAMINSRNAMSRNFWGNFSEPSRTTPPPPAFLPRGSSSGISLDDMSMDSPLQTTTTNSSATGGAGGSANPFTIATGIQPGSISLASLPPTTTTSSSGNGTPQPAAAPNSQEASQQLPSNSSSANSLFINPKTKQSLPQPLPTAAEITRRINSKRRRDDDLDPVSFKRRAVSPGMGNSSVQGSPVMQSPLQRDMAPWGSRPGSGAGLPGGGSAGTDKEWERGRQLERESRVSGSSAVSESGSVMGCPPGGNGGGGGGRVTGKGRIGYQGMVDTNDGITKLSIE